MHAGYIWIGIGILAAGLSAFSLWYGPHLLAKSSQSQQGIAATITGNNNIAIGKVENSSINISPQEKGSASSQENAVENKRKKMEIRIARSLEDAEAWLPKHKSVFLNQVDRIMNDAAGRNMVHSGSHVKLHINNTNSFIETIDAYLKDMTRQIQDFLLEIGEVNLETAKDFQNEYRRFEAFKQAAEVAVDWAKQQNYSVCSRFTDKPTLDNILKSGKYVR